MRNHTDTKILTDRTDCHNATYQLSMDFPGGFHTVAADPENHFIHVSDQMLTMLGFSREDIRTRFANSFQKLVYPGDQTRFIDFYREENQTPDTVMEFEYRLQANNEKGFIWIKNITQVCEDEDGRLYYQGLLLDITEPIETQQSLALRNREMQVITHSIPGGMVITGEKYPYRYEYFSHEAASLFGYTTDEILELTHGYAINLVYEGDRRRTQHTVDQALLAGNCYSVKYRVHCKDGSFKYIMDCGKRMFNSEGRPCLISLYLDVTKEQENEYLINLQNKLLKKEAELSRQREENTRKEALIHALCRDYSNVFYVDLDTNAYEVFRINEELPDPVKQIMQGKAGFSCFIDKYISKIVYPADRDEMLARLSIRNLYKELKEKKSFTHTYRVERDGAITYFQVKCARVKLEQAVSRFVLGIRNIDGEIRAEMEKNQLLADALEHAQCANRAKTSFLNNMSHDIRTPMNAIIGFTELAQKHIDDPARVADYLGKIEQSSKHLLSLINDVLDMSRIEAGKVQLDEQPDNLSDIIGNLRDIIEADIRSRNLVFTIDTVDVTEEEIFCDRLRLNQVLLNLLSNAMKFTKANGKVSVLLTQYPSAKAGYATYEFRVRDTGIGMSDEFAAHIFEPFTREHTSTVSGIQGTGLGMSITKNFVDMMGGTIAVNSKLGEGTEFIVTLEFKLAAEQPHTLSDKETAHTGESLHGLRILLAEDNELNTEIAVELLTEAGCILETAKNGQEAAEMVENHAPGHYDLVLMDIQMPVMDGYEATRRIRSFREPQLASIPIIAMTANAFEEDRQNALACGMNAHIAKPIDVDRLFDTIQSVQNIKR